MTALTRGAFEIVRDFAAASSRLNNMARDWTQGQFKAGDKTDANNLLEGLRALLAELRTQEANG